MKVKIEKIEIKCYVSIVIFRITKKKIWLRNVKLDKKLKDKDIIKTFF